MDEAKLRRFFEKHRVLFSDSELVAAAFDTSMDFPDWDQWFDEIKKRFGDAEIHKLQTASISILEDLPTNADQFGVSHITPERSAAETIEGGNWIPTKFLLFLQGKTKGGLF